VRCGHARGGIERPPGLDQRGDAEETDHTEPRTDLDPEIRQPRRIDEG
jgi:hypothetical protein